MQALLPGSPHANNVLESDKVLYTWATAELNTIPASVVFNTAVRRADMCHLQAALTLLQTLYMPRFSP